MFKIFQFWLGVAAPQTPQNLAGGAKRPQTPPARTYLAFDRGGQTRLPRPNAFFFGAADDTGTADDTGAADAGPSENHPLQHRLPMAPVSGRNDL